MLEFYLRLRCDLLVVIDIQGVMYVTVFKYSLRNFSVTTLRSK